MYVRIYIFGYATQSLVRNGHGSNANGYICFDFTESTDNSLKHLRISTHIKHRHCNIVNELNLYSIVTVHLQYYLPKLNSIDLSLIYSTETDMQIN